MRQQGAVPSARLVARVRCRVPRDEWELPVSEQSAQAQVDEVQLEQLDLGVAQLARVALPGQVLVDRERPPLELGQSEAWPGVSQQARRGPRAVESQPERLQSALEQRQARRAERRA